MGSFNMFLVLLVFFFATLTGSWCDPLLSRERDPRLTIVNVYSGLEDVGGTKSQPTDMSSDDECCKSTYSDSKIADGFRVNDRGSPLKQFKEKKSYKLQMPRQRQRLFYNVLSTTTSTTAQPEKTTYRAAENHVQEYFPKSQMDWDLYKKLLESFREKKH